MSEKVNQGEIVESPPKRKRGRPRKEKPNNGIVNEGESRILMEQGNGNSGNIIGKEIMSQQKYERINLEQVQRKWNTVFSKYSTLLAQNGNISSLNGLLNNVATVNALNPFVQNKRVKEIIAQGEKVDKNKVMDYLANPQENEFNIQNASWAMYYQSQIYQTLLRLDRDIPRFHYYVIPQNVKKEDLSEEKYKKEKKKVDSILKVLKPKVTFKDMIEQLSNEGKTFYIPRISFDDKEAFFFTFQKLPSRYCKIVGFGSDEHFIIMFDMSIFLNGIYDIRQYPQFIQDKWNEMLNAGIVEQGKDKKYKINPKTNIPDEDILEFADDTWCYWYRLPQNMAFTFSQAGGNPNVLPDSTALLGDIVDLNDYKILQQNLLARGATALLTAEAQIKTDSPVGTDPSYVSVDTLLGITDYVTQKVGDTIVPVFFPLHDYKLHDIQEDVSPATQVVTSRLRDVVSTSSLSGLISQTDKPSIITVKTARDLAMAKARYIVSQFENVVNKIINSSFELNYEWKVHFWGYCFDELDDIKTMKEMILSGMKGLLPRLLSAYDLTLEEYQTSYDMCNALDLKVIKDELIYQVENNNKMQDKALENSLQQQQISIKNKVVDTGINETKKVGRPAKTDDELESDATAASRDTANDSETKEFSKQVMSLVEELGISDMNLDDDELMEAVSEELSREMENTDIVRNYERK